MQLRPLLFLHGENMATSASLVLTPQQEEYLATSTFAIKTPTTAIGRKLHDKGLERECFRYENCGMVRIRKCPNNHVDRRLRYCCGNRFTCNDCAKRNAQERFEAWPP